MEFGVGSVDAFVHAELVEVGAVGGVELAGAVVDGVGVVVGDAFSAGVVVGALDDAGDGLRAGGVVGVGVGRAFVGGEEVLRGGVWAMARGGVPRGRGWLASRERSRGAAHYSAGRVG